MFYDYMIFMMSATDTQRIQHYVQSVADIIIELGGDKIWTSVVMIKANIACGKAFSKPVIMAVKTVLANQKQEP